MALFADRRDAGIRLGAALRERLDPLGADAVRAGAEGADAVRAGAEGADAVRAGAEGAGRLVVGLARGGVVVAEQVARALNCPLDVLVVRKIGHPQRPELGLGALAETGEAVVNDALLRRLAVPVALLDEVAARERAEARRRVVRYRGERLLLPVRGCEVVVDDGLATGYTALVAVASVRARGASRVVLGVPVGAPETVRLLAAVTDDVVCLAGPTGLSAVGEAYDDFGETGDDEVVAALRRAGTTSGHQL